jgi:hypothetical protein
VAEPDDWSITEIRYFIWEHLLWSGAPLVGGAHPYYERVCPDPTLRPTSVPCMS